MHDEPYVLRSSLLNGVHLRFCPFWTLETPAISYCDVMMQAQGQEAAITEQEASEEELAAQMDDMELLKVPSICRSSRCAYHVLIEVHGAPSTNLNPCLT